MPIFIQHTMNRQLTHWQDINNNSHERQDRPYELTYCESPNQAAPTVNQRVIIVIKARSQVSNLASEESVNIHSRIYSLSHCRFRIYSLSHCHLFKFRVISRSGTGPHWWLNHVATCAFPVRPGSVNRRSGERMLGAVRCSWGSNPS